MICRSVGACPVVSPTTSATATSPQLSSSDCCCQCMAAAAGLPYTPVDSWAGVGPPLAVEDVPGEAAAGAWKLQPDMRVTTAVPMHATASAQRCEAERNVHMGSEI